MGISLPWRKQRPPHSSGPVIESSLTPAEAVALSELASTGPGGVSQRVLEIGSAYGFSAVTMALAGANVTSIDHHSHMDSFGAMHSNLMSYGVANRVTMHAQDSRAALPWMKSGEFDGAFIDGDHTADGVTFDANQCLRLVKPGGWLAFHDYNEETCKEVAPALDALFGTSKLDHILIDTLYIVKVPYPKPWKLPHEPILTVVTLTIPGREESLRQLQDELSRQISECGHYVEHLIEEGPERYGVKMRRSTERASGRYVCWMDDDDFPTPDYIQSIVDGINSTPEPDVVTIGSCTPGCVPAWLRYGVTDNSGIAPDGGNIKAANHYCAWRRWLALSSPWLPRNYGAEFIWYTVLRKRWAGLLIEYHIPKVIHTYLYNASGTRCQDRPSIDDSLKDFGNRVLVLQHKDGQILAATNIPPTKHKPTTYRVQWPNGITLTIPVTDVKVIDEIIYR